MDSHSWTVRAASCLSTCSQTRMRYWISGRRVVPAMHPFYVASMRKDASESPRLYCVCALAVSDGAVSESRLGYAVPMLGIILPD